MASYFDEHNCEPLGPGETPNHLLHMARLLLDSGVGVDFNMDFARMLGHERPPPPASEKFVDTLKVYLIQDNSKGESCAVCLKPYDEDDEVKVLPCKHQFHITCIHPWLKKTNSCPVCRFELPTDDPDYEEYIKQRKRTKQRETDLETLHNSMFG